MTKPRHRRRLLSLAIVVVAIASGPPPALAEQSQWVPVIVEQQSADQTLALVNAVATVLRTQHDVDLIDPAIAARRFESLHSAAPVEVPDEELRELGDGFRKALEAAALGQWDTAYELVRNFDELSQPVQDYVTWRLNLSRDIFDYCLMSVHWMLNAGRDGAAREEMRNCIYSAPQRTLTPKETPERLIQLHDAVKAELLAKGEATLDVDASGVPASTTGCVVVVNGAPKGALPYREVGLLPVPVRIQVNCQRPGRIHLVQLAPGRNSMIVDLRFERIVRTDGYLGLRYGDGREETNSEVRDGLTVAKVIGASDLLLVGKLSDGRISFRRFTTSLEKLVSEVTLAPKASADEIRAAALALATSRSGAIAAVHDDPPVGPTDAIHHDTRDPFAGAVIAVGSISSFALGWVGYAERMRFRNDVAERNACVADAQDKIDVICVQGFAKHQTLGDFTLAFGALGAALGTAASPALLPDRNGVPAWSWLVGAAGVGAAAVGAVLWSNGESCSFGHCDADQLDPSLGQLILLHSPPLIAVPITYAVRALLRTNDVQAHASYQRSSGSITVTGRF